MFWGHDLRKLHINEMLRVCSVLLIALALTSRVLAAQPQLPAFSMTGLTDTGDTAILKLDAAPSASGSLIIVGDHTQGRPRTMSLSYHLLPVKSNVEGDPRVEVIFSDKHSLIIMCDPLSDNCRSDSFITEGGVTFALLWHINRR